MSWRLRNRRARRVRYLRFREARHAFLRHAIGRELRPIPHWPAGSGDAT